MEGPGFQRRQRHTYAPTVLDLTSVSIGNQAAFVSYVSPTQVNALVPSNVGLGPQPVVVSTGAGASNAFTINVSLTQPTLLALPRLTWAARNTWWPRSPISSPMWGRWAHSRASPRVRPSLGIPLSCTASDSARLRATFPPAQVVQPTQYNSLLNPIQFFFGGTPAATPGYYGLAPEETGFTSST